jgi:hypothetical protein
VRAELTEGLDVKHPGIWNTAPEYFGLMGVAHGPLRRRHSAEKAVFFSERRSSILVSSRRCALNLLPPMVGGRRGLRGMNHDRELSIKEDKKCAEPGGGP